LKTFNGDFKILEHKSEIGKFSKDRLEIKKDELMNGKELKNEELPLKAWF